MVGVILKYQRGVHMAIKRSLRSSNKKNNHKNRNTE